jgi:hypothetical protein
VDELLVTIICILAALQARGENQIPKEQKKHEISKKLFHKDRRRSDAPTGLS